MKQFLCCLCSISVIGFSTAQDISLEFTSEEMTYVPFFHSAFQLTATNNGTTSVNDLEICLDFIDGIFVPTERTTATQGTYTGFTKCWEVGTLAPNTSANLNLVLFAVGDYEIVEMTAQLMGTSTSASLIILPQPEELRRPDLTLHSLQFPDTVRLGGSTTLFNYMLQNVGVRLAFQNFRISNFISRDSLLSPDDTYIGQVQTGNIGVVASFPVGGAVHIPTEFETGWYYLILEVDSDDVVPEIDESNNTISTPVYLINEGIALNLECPEDITQHFPAGLALDQVEDYGFTLLRLPKVASNCPTKGITYELLSEHDYVQLFYNQAVRGEGVFDIQFLVEDECGNEELCTYTITHSFEPGSAQISNCPEDITIQATNNDGAIVHFDYPDLITNCNDPILVSSLSDFDSGSLFPIGETEVHLLADSPQCGADSCIFTVTVTPPSMNFEVGNTQAITFQISPNPVQDWLTCHFERTTSARLLIHNIQGQLLYTYSIPEMLEQQQIETSNWEAGLYLITWQGDQQTQHLRFMKE